MTVPQEDRDRVRDDYTDPEDLTQEQVEQDLRDADFDGDSAESFAKAIAGAEDMPENRQALQDAQREALSNVKSGGAVGGQVLQGKDPETGRNKTIGKPENVTQEIQRTGTTEGEVVAVNKNTGTRGVVGTVDLPRPPTGDSQ